MLLRVVRLAAFLLPLGSFGCAPPPSGPARTPAPSQARESSAKKADREARIEVKMPDLPDGASCAEAATAYRESWSLDGHDQRADLTEGQYAMILGRDRYFQHCDLPARYEVAICAAVQNGQVLGASVSTTPRSPRHETCIDRSLRALDFPVHPRMDVTRTVFQN